MMPLSVAGRSEAPLRIPGPIVREMVDHCRRDAPLEACGLLGGVGDLVSSFHPLANARASETRYEADPHQLIEAVVWLRERSHGIQAIYHSHPRWAAIPSGTDLATNYWGETPRMIVSLLDEPPDIRLYCLYPNAYRELPWKPVFDWEQPGGDGVSSPRDRGRPG